MIINVLIHFSVIFIRQYFSNSVYKPLEEMLPSIPVLVSLFLSLVITSVSEVGLDMRYELSDFIMLFFYGFYAIVFHKQNFLDNKLNVYTYDVVMSN